MAKGIFLSLPVDKIEQILGNAVAALATGGTVQTGWSIGENSSSKAIAMNPSDVIEECNYALGRLAPEKYPALKPVTRTLADFS
jgi:hypothetical protein